MESMIKEFKDIINNTEEINCTIIVKQIDNNLEILNVVGDYHKALGIMMEDLLNREAKEKDFRYTLESMFNNNGIIIETTSGKGKEAVTNKYFILKYAKKANTKTTYPISCPGDETVDPIISMP